MYGKRLRKARKNARLTLKEVGDSIFSSHATVSRYETEKMKLDTQTLAELCKLYNVSADYILGLPKDMPYPNDED